MTRTPLTLASVAMMLAASAPTAQAFQPPLMRPAPITSASPSPSTASSPSTRRPTLNKRTVKLDSYPTDGTPQGNARQIEQALESLRLSGGGTLLLPARTIKVQPRGWIQVPRGVGIKGTSSASQLTLIASDEHTYTELFKYREGDNTLENVKLTRGSKVYGRMLDFSHGSNIYLENVLIDGKHKQYGGDFAAITLAMNTEETLQKLTLVRSTIMNTTYALVESSEPHGLVSDVLIDGNTFTNNYASDLELNAPLGRGESVVITNNTFTNNNMTTEMAGFGVGLANFHQVRIEGNTFTNYAMNPIHIEDRSSDVLVARNTFKATSTIPTGYASDIIILSGAHDITVRNNTSDNTQQANPKYFLYAGSGAPTATEPYNITLGPNYLTLRAGDQDYVNDTHHPFIILNTISNTTSLQESSTRHAMLSSIPNKGPSSLNK